MKYTNRRTMLKIAGTGIAAAGFGLVGGLPALADAEDPEFPDVPGMLGDRRSNELWYVYERDFFYQPSDEVMAAYQTAGQVFGGSIDGIYNLYSETRKDGTFPARFRSGAEPAKPALAVLSRLQLEILGRYCRNEMHLARAFLYMGEGTLYDPRMPVGFKVHMMNSGPHGEPPMSWHVWHATTRAMMLLDLDVQKWATVDKYVALGWVAQSIAKPVPDAVNPGLGRRKGSALIREWWQRTTDEVDVAFDSVPYPGIGKPSS